MTIGDRIKVLRGNSTAREIAKSFGVSQPTWTTWEIRKLIERHVEKKAAFAELGKLFPVDLTKGTEELLQTIMTHRADIEKDDGRGYPCLDILCHNEECQARGMLDERKPLSLIQRHIGTWLIPMPYIEC